MLADCHRWFTTKEQTKRIFVIFVLLKFSLQSANFCNAENTVSELVSRLEPELWRRAEAVRHLAVPLADSQFHSLVEEMVRQRVPVHAESEDCRAHSHLVVDAVMRGEIWALRMLEASSMIPSRILEGNVMNVGHYHECVASTEPNDLFIGQHCLVETRGIIPKELQESINFDLSDVPPEPRATLERYFVLRDLSLSVCVPSSCSPHDVQVHMDRVLAPVNASALVFDSSCSTARPLPLQPMDYVAITVFIGIFAIVAWSSIADRQSSGPKSDVVEAFSLGRNWRRLTDTRASAGDISCLHGVRVLATAGIVLAHRVSAFTFFTREPIATGLEMTDSFLVPICETLIRNVDVFFMIGGTVRAYGFFQDRYKGRQLDVVSSIARRYLRYTPTMAMVMLYKATLLIHSSSGPVWRRMLDYTTWCCRANWPLNILLIHNYIAPLASCVAESWYLAADFQMFIFSSFILIPLYFRPTIGLILLILTGLGSMASFAVTAYAMEVSACSFTFNHKWRNEFTKELYFRTHYRAPAYLLGLGLGYLLFTLAQKNKPPKFPKAVLWTGWTLWLAMVALLVGGAKVILATDYRYTPWLDVSFMVLGKPLAAAAAAWVVLVCTQGYGGIVNDILSWRGFQPLSRLTLGVYLVNLGLISGPYYARQTSLVDEDLATIIHLSLGDLVLATAIAVPLYLCVELPCNTLASRYLVTPVPYDPVLAAASAAKPKNETYQPVTQRPKAETMSTTQKVKKKKKK